MINLPVPIEIPLSQIILDDSNPNEMTQEMFQGLGRSLNEFGLYDTILVGKPKDGIYTVKNGNHRIKSLRDNGVPGSTKIWAFSFDGTEAELSLLRQSLNKTHGAHNPQKDLLEFAMLEQHGKMNLLSELLAKPQTELLLPNPNAEILLPPLPASAETFTPPAAEQEPIAQKGIVYKLGRHRISCGDSKTNLSEFLGDTKVNVLFTDPPYGINIVSHALSKPEQAGTVGNKKGTLKGFKAKHLDDKTILKGFTSNHGAGAMTAFKNKGYTSGHASGRNSIVKATQYRQIIGDDIPFDPTYLLNYGDTQIIFGANHFSDKLPVNSHWLVWDKKAQDESRLRDSFSDVELLWTNVKHKTSFIYRHLWSGLMRAGDRKTELLKRIHPTQKPVGLLCEILKDYSKPGDIILDPYLGSGSMLIACEHTGRTCYGMEIDPLYVDVIVKRWEDYTGLKAEVPT